MTDQPRPDAATLRRWRSARNILAVRLDNLGDVLMTTPALAAIRETLPEARLTMLTSPSGAALARHLPAVDEVIPFVAPWVRHPEGQGEPECGATESAMLAKLAERRFDAAIIFTVCTQSALPAALFCRMAGIPLRLAHSRENPYALLTDWIPDPDTIGDGMRHEVRRQLALVAAVGFAPRHERLRFRFEAEHVRRLRRRMAAAGFDSRQPYFVVHPGATAPSRRYPAARFGAAAELIVRDSGCTAIYTGTRGEEKLVEEARGQMSGKAISLAGQLDLGELGALIGGARVLVANNTGTVHLAAALETPVVDLYALTNPQHTPWQVRAHVLSHDVPCRNCLKSDCPAGHHDCLRRIGPEAVAEASLDLMGAELDPAVPLAASPFPAWPPAGAPRPLSATEAGR
ncbi:MAG: glycosyltransferase family 9 protein [Betaproteobacteria bacterium]